MTIDEQIAVLTAIKDGVPVEYQGKGELNAWRPLKYEIGKCNFADLEYRIVEEPKTLEEEIKDIFKGKIMTISNVGQDATIALHSGDALEEFVLKVLDKRYKRIDKE